MWRELYPAGIHYLIGQILGSAVLLWLTGHVGNAQERYYSYTLVITGLTGVLVMFPAVYYASFLFPVRHFVEINQNLLYGDYGFAYTWQNISALFLFILPAILILPHLKKAILSHKYENIK